jgi:hypothetical protein
MFGQCQSEEKVGDAYDKGSLTETDVQEDKPIT